MKITMDRSLATTTYVGCVYNETELVQAIENTPAYTPTRIDLCSSYIKINASQPKVLGIGGINVLNKILSIYCNVSTAIMHQCSLDAQKLSRHFAIQESTISFHTFPL
jgi:hypothetical protein